MILIFLNFFQDILIELISNNCKYAMRQRLFHVANCRAGKMPEGTIFMAFTIYKRAKHFITPFLRQNFTIWRGRGQVGRSVIIISVVFRIKELRQASGLTQSQLAAKLKLKSSSTVTMWENGTRRPPSVTLPVLADVLGCTIDALYGREKGGEGSG